MIRLHFSTLLFWLAISIAINNAECKSRLRRMIGGVPDFNHEIKYAVAIELNNKIQCTGSIIHDLYIVTAAHCVIDSTDNTFFIGQYVVVAAINGRNDQNAIRRSVKKIYVPSTYNPLRKKTGDIAVLKLAVSLNLDKNPNLSKLAIPRQIKSVSFENKYVDQVGIVSGYGIFDNFSYNVYTDANGIKRTSRNGDYPNILQVGSAQIISQSNCSILHNDEIIDESQMCARLLENELGHRGVCAGDSGGPLVQNTTLIGVVSFGSMVCDDRIRPMVYTVVHYFTDFIMKAVNDNKKLRSLEYRYT